MVISSPFSILLFFWNGSEQKASNVKKAFFLYARVQAWHEMCVKVRKKVARCRWWWMLSISIQSIWLIKVGNGIHCIHLMPFLAKFDQWWWPLTVLIEDHLNWILSMKSWLMMVMRFILSFDAIFGLNSIDIDGDGGTQYKRKVLLNWLQRRGWIGTEPKCRDEADGSPYQSKVNWLQIRGWIWSEPKGRDSSPYQSKVLPDWTRSAWRQRPHLETAALGSFRQIHLQRRCLNHFLEFNSYKNLQRRCVNHFSELKSYKSQNSHVSTSPTPSSGRAPKCRQILFTFVLDDYIVYNGFQ